MAREGATLVADVIHRRETRYNSLNLTRVGDFKLDLRSSALGLSLLKISAHPWVPVRGL